jgi:hypothetical protein
LPNDDLGRDDSAITSEVAGEVGMFAAIAAGAFALLCIAFAAKCARQRRRKQQQADPDRIVAGWTSPAVGNVKVSLSMPSSTFVKLARQRDADNLKPLGRTVPDDDDRFDSVDGCGARHGDARSPIPPATSLPPQITPPPTADTSSSEKSSYRERVQRAKSNNIQRARSVNLAGSGATAARATAALPACDERDVLKAKAQAALMQLATPGVTSPSQWDVEKV